MKLQVFTILLLLNMSNCFSSGYLRRSKEGVCFTGRHKEVKIGDECPYPGCPRVGQRIASLKNSDDFYTHKHIGDSVWYAPDGSVVKIG